MVKMKVTGVTIDPFTNIPFIILKDMDEKKAIPIWIGLLEASAIATKLENIKLARPMTHDLIKAVLDSLDVKISRVEITDLTNDTYYASIYLDKGNETFIIDARPSDAIALALRSQADIWVAEKVISKSRAIDLTKKDKEGATAEKDKCAEILESLSPSDFGKYKM